MGNADRDILLIEDDLPQQLLYRRILEKAGYRTRVRTTAREVLDSLGTEEVPDLILCDIVMPDLDGLSFLSELERQPAWCRVPVVMMTAEPTAERIACAYSLPVPPEGFLVKPVRSPALLRMVADVLGKEGPLQTLRAAQRSHLHTCFERERELTSSQRSLAGARQAIEDCKGRLAKSRREAETLRRELGNTRNVDDARRQQAQEQLARLESASRAYLDQIASFDAEISEVLARQAEIAKQFDRDLRSLEEIIRSLAQTIAGSEEARDQAA